MKSRSSNWQTGEEIFEKKKLWLSPPSVAALTAHQISCRAQFNKPKRKAAHLLADLLPRDDKKELKKLVREEDFSWIKRIFWCFFKTAFDTAATIEHEKERW